MKNRRELLGMAAVTAAALATDNVLAKAFIEEETLCENIKYPKKGYTMKFDDMTGIGSYEAKRMGLQVYECQRDIAAKEMLNHLYRLKFLKQNGINLFEHAQLAASLARQEMKGEKYDDQYVVASLLFNVGMVLSPKNPHLTIAAILKPYIEEKLYFALYHYEAYKLNPSAHSHQDWSESAYLLHKWQEDAYSTTIKPTKFSKLRDKVKDLFWADAIFKDIPHEKVIPE